jgi:hypothetical protein
MSRILDPTFISNSVDYSFGDQSGYHNGICEFKNANIKNLEFLEVYNRIKSEKNVMTLFIDNIRLYSRKNIKYTAIELINEYNKNAKDNIVQQYYYSDNEQNLLKLCSQLPDMNFIIFTGFEDTPIDEDIFENIPQNVLRIYASNAIVFGGKVIPIPYGVQRKLHQFDNRHDIILRYSNNSIEPIKLLYVNHTNHNNERALIYEMLSNKPWVTCATSSGVHNYENYLTNILNHKFMICPDGNAIGCECHRDWEVLYMGRVPIVKDSEYLRTIFKGLPVLFVKSFSDVTEELLIENDFLYDMAKKLDKNMLSYDNLINDEILIKN